MERHKKMKIIISEYKERRSPFVQKYTSSQQNRKREKRYENRTGNVKTVEEVYPQLVDEIFNKVWGLLK